MVKRQREEAGFVLPEPAAILDLAMDDGAPVRVVRHGNLSGPRVVLSHGNGFASDSYFPFWRLMLERFDLALFDIRNCGRNPFHAAEVHHYPRFARDNAAVHGAIAGEWGENATIGVFHSMSAIAALLSVIEGVWHWDALVLFDPPVVPSEGSPQRGPLMNEGEALRDAARIRTNRFANPNELADVFRYLHRSARSRWRCPSCQVWPARSRPRCARWRWVCRCGSRGTGWCGRDDERGGRRAGCAAGHRGGGEWKEAARFFLAAQHRPVCGLC